MAIYFPKMFKGKFEETKIRENCQWSIGNLMNKGLGVMEKVLWVKYTFLIFLFAKSGSTDFIKAIDLYQSQLCSILSRE